MSETTELPSSRLVALDFAEDINRLIDEFVGRGWIFAEIDPPAVDLQREIYLCPLTSLALASARHGWP